MAGFLVVLLVVWLVCWSVSRLVSLSVCQQDYSKTTEQISTKPGRRMSLSQEWILFWCRSR